MYLYMTMDYVHVQDFFIYRKYIKHKTYLLKVYKLQENVEEISTKASLNTYSLAA